jgi:phage terminase large subunit
MELTIATPRKFKPLLNPSRYKAIFGGRGSAKSHFFAESLIERCILQKTDWVCLREVQKTLDQSVKKLLEAKIEKFGVGNLFEVQQNKIKAPYGGIIIFNGMQDHTAESIKSLEGFDGAWFEEAQTMSQRSLDLLRPTIRKDGSEIWFSFNPTNETDPVDQFFRKDRPPNSIVVEANYMDNPWFPEVLRVEMEWDKARDYDKYSHIWLGQYNVNTNSRVFKNWRVEEFETGQDEIFRFGADWGYSVDPSVLVRCFLKGNNLYVDWEAYMIGCEIINLPELFMTIPESEKWPITADSARPETISHMQRNGFPRMRPAVKGTKSIEEGINFMQSFDLIVHPRCQHTIDELKMYSYRVDPLTGDVLPLLADKHNHVVDSLMYALEGARRLQPGQAVIPPSRAQVSSWMGR